jgi:hypothetical protein
MKKILFVSVAVIFSVNIFAQKITPVNERKLIKLEDSLKGLALQIIQGRTAGDRFTADSQFTKMFVRALKIPNSFYYRFDSLFTISRLAPKDSSFKIYTWQMVINDNVIRQHGAIQINKPDGSLKLFPLIDKSDVTLNIADTVGNNFGWIGAVYYRLIETQFSGKKYFTLLGYDENNIRSNKKIVEVLSFESGQPVFGSVQIYYPKSSSAKNNARRLILEYKKNASPRLVYDADQNMIVYEHLISETGENQKKYTYVGDGDYEGLQWKDGRWQHVERVFTQVTNQGDEPLPNPIRDGDGNVDRSKLKNNGLDVDGNKEPVQEKIKVTPSKIKVKKK